MENRFLSKINTRERTKEEELMDDFSLTDIKLTEALDKIAKVNQLLGGNRTTLQGVQRLLGNLKKSTPYKIIDIGCGNGDMLRMMAKYGKEKGFNFELLGIDANKFTIDYARSLSKDQKNISYECSNIFHEDFKKMKGDIFLCTLTLHHFKDEDIEQLLTVLKNNSRIGIVINDLQRSKIAYRLFQFYCTIFNLKGMPKTDGLISVLRGFKKGELIAFSEKLNFKNYHIHWKWAFRYQWIISNI